MSPTKTESNEDEQSNKENKGHTLVFVLVQYVTGIGDWLTGGQQRHREKAPQEKKKLKASHSNHVIVIRSLFCLT